MKKLMYIIAVCLAFATCSKVEQEVDPSPESPTSFKKGQKVTLSYTTDVQSKVSSSIDASGISFTWEEGDQILVSVGGSTGTFTLTKGAGTATAEFSGEMPADGTTFDVQYPTSTPSLSSQTYQAGNLPKDKVLFTASGCQLGQSYTLNNQSAVVCFNLTGEKSVGSIVFNSNTLSCGGVALSSSPKSFYMVVPTGTYSFNVDVKDTNGTTICSFASTEAKTFSANSCLNLATKDVKPVLVESITLNKTSTELVVGGTDNLSVTEVLPSTAYDKTYTWSSDADAIATVDQTGKVTAVAKGTTKIKCTANDGSGKYAECDVTVKKLVTSITLDPSSVSTTFAKSGETKTVTLTATVLPADASDQSVEWSSSDNRITVNNSGVVTIPQPKNGNEHERGAIITCTAKDGSNVKQTCTVSLTDNFVAVTGVSINETAPIADIAVGYTYQLSKTVSPSNATDQTVTWSSSEESIATVDETGKVTGVAAGKCTITCKSNSDETKSDSREVNIVTVAVTGISLSPSEVTRDKAASYDAIQIVPTISPANATNKNVSWESNNTSLVAVDNSGNLTITPNTTGEATITCTTQDGGKSATCTVKIVEGSVKVTGITLKEDGSVVTEKTVQVGSAPFTLTATVSPDNATTKTVSWTTSDDKVVTVSGGVVTVVGVGNATITCSATDGSGVSATCSVTVTPIYVEEISLKAESSTTIKQGTSVVVTATISPTDATTQTLEWSISKANKFSLTTISNNQVRVTNNSANNDTITLTCKATDRTTGAASKTITITGTKN